MMSSMGVLNPPVFRNIPCCLCGIPIQPTKGIICANCLQSQVDITEGLQKQVIVIHCPECNRYLQPPSTWVSADLESSDLLKLFINRLKNLKTVRLVGAEWIWTEPNSKRLKVKLMIQKEVLSNLIVQQSYVVEYTVQDQMCGSCSRVQANPDQWVAVVQLRQRVTHRRTFLYLEQLILKHNAASCCTRIKQMNQGIDFFFSKQGDAKAFVEFVKAFTPAWSRSDSKQLVSHDTKSNNYNYKYTFPVEISPICREDLICLPRKVSASGSGDLVGRLVVCTKVTSCIVLLDPSTARHCLLDAKQCQRWGFKPLVSSRQLVEYIVLDVEAVSSEVNVGGTKYVLAYAQVARVSDFGRNNRIFTVKTHLGHLLNPGDHALGYDLESANTNDIELDNLSDVPDVILIKKSYEDKRKNNKVRRPWKLMSLDMEAENSGNGRYHDDEKKDAEYEQFLRDLEEDPELRFGISLYRDKGYEASEMASSMGEDDDVPQVPLEELLADLDISDPQTECDNMSE